MIFDKCPKGYKEGQYNSLFVENYKDKYVCMDRKQIIYVGGHSSIELCDILGSDNTLIHVKKYMLVHLH